MSYEQGFIDKCAHYGVDPQELIKYAQSAGDDKKDYVGGKGIDNRPKEERDKANAKVQEGIKKSKEAPGPKLGPAGIKGSPGNKAYQEGKKNDLVATLKTVLQNLFGGAGGTAAVSSATKGMGLVDPNPKRAPFGAMY